MLVEPGRPKKRLAPIREYLTKVTMRALVLDDNEQIAKATAMILRMRGFDADFVFCPEQATAMIVEHHYDVVVTDLELQHHTLTGMDILAAAKRYRPEARRVLTSGAEQPLDLDPEVPFLPKPSSIGELMNAIGLDPARNLV